MAEPIKRYCCQCTALKHHDWKYCPYCGHQAHYEGDSNGNRIAGAQPEVCSQQSQTAGYPPLHPGLQEAFRLIQDEIAIQTGKAKRLEATALSLTKHNDELREELKIRKQPPPFRVGEIIGVRSEQPGVTFVLQIDQINFEHPFVNIRVRLP